MKHTREDAGSPSSPAPASTSNEIIFDISRAEKLCSDALSTSPLQPAVAASALAAVPTDPASRSADVPMAEPTSQPAQLSPIPRVPRLERPYPSDGICGRDPWWITPAPVPSGMVTGPSPVLDGGPRHDAGTLPPGVETLVERGSPSSPVLA